MTHPYCHLDASVGSEKGLCLLLWPELWQLSTRPSPVGGVSGVTARASPVLSPAIPGFYPPQGLLIKAEVVGYFMSDYPLYLGGNLFFTAAYGLDRLLENGDLIWRHHAVSSGASGLRHSFIKTEQSHAGPRPAELRPGRIVLHRHIDIVQHIPKLFGQLTQGLGH